MSQKFPAAALTAQTMHQVAEIAFAAGEWEWAGSLFNGLIERGKESPYYAAALSGSAWCLYRQNKFREAADGFDRFLKELPENVELGPEAAYMRAKSLYDADDLKAPKPHFPLPSRDTLPSRRSPEKKKKGQRLTRTDPACRRLERCISSTSPMMPTVPTMLC